jgi:hypothetical protein
LEALKITQDKTDYLWLELKHVTTMWAKRLTVF